ncbi:MAG: glutathione S-transferase N-terminal domain-containing protein, partial [Pseudomonadota bacterium]
MDDMADTSGTALPVLYSFRRCPYAMRARLALLASGQRCELREVVLRDKPAALIAVSPKATVPVLVTAEGTVIEQSLDIMLWALRRSDPSGWLQPGDASLDEMLSLVAQCDTHFKPELDRYKYPGRYADTDPLMHREAGAVFLRRLDARLTQWRFLAGPAEALADAAIAPFVRQFAMVDA